MMQPSLVGRPIEFLSRYSNIADISCNEIVQKMVTSSGIRRNRQRGISVCLQQQFEHVCLNMLLFPVARMFRLSQKFGFSGFVNNWNFREMDSKSAWITDGKNIYQVDENFSS